MNPFRLIDLTHTIDETIPTWTGSCGFSHSVKSDYDRGVRVLSYKMHGGIGTHMDAPTHFIREGKSIAEIPLEELCVPCVVLDLSAKRSPNLFIQPEEISAFEKEHGKLPAGCILFGYTGWQEFWPDPQKYRNVDSQGKMHFPGFSKTSAELLVERQVVGIGIDTLSPDGSNSDHFPVHEILLGSGKYIVENLTHLDQLPPVGAYALLLPIKVGVGTEAAIRAVGLLPS